MDVKGIDIIRGVSIRRSLLEVAELWVQVRMHVCAYLGQRETTRGIPQVPSMVVWVGFCFVLF